MRAGMHLYRWRGLRSALFLFLRISRFLHDAARCLEISRIEDAQRKRSIAKEWSSRDFDAIELPQRRVGRPMRFPDRARARELHIYNFNDLNQTYADAQEPCSISRDGSEF